MSDLMQSVISEALKRNSPAVEERERAGCSRESKAGCTKACGQPERCRHDRAAGEALALPRRNYQKEQAARRLAPFLAGGAAAPARASQAPPRTGGQAPAWWAATQAAATEAPAASGAAPAPAGSSRPGTALSAAAGPADAEAASASAAALSPLLKLTLKSTAASISRRPEAPGREHGAAPAHLRAEQAPGSRQNSLPASGGAQLAASTPDGRCQAWLFPELDEDTRRLLEIPDRTSRAAAILTAPRHWPSQLFALAELLPELPDASIRWGGRQPGFQLRLAAADAGQLADFPAIARRIIASDSSRTISTAYCAQPSPLVARHLGVHMADGAIGALEKVERLGAIALLDRLKRRSPNSGLRFMVEERYTLVFGEGAAVQRALADMLQDALQLLGTDGRGGGESA